MPVTDTRNTTSYIKGVAILCVITAHYVSNYAFDFYQQWLTEYAVTIISVFFVISGYGIYHSLERRFQDSQATTGRTLLRFAYDRAISLYPLYWGALTLIGLLNLLGLMPAFGNYDNYFPHDLNTVLMWLGIPVIRFFAFWFVTSIIQCWYVAPLLYFVLRRYGLAAYAMLTVWILLATFAVTCIFAYNLFGRLHLPVIEQPLVFFYKGYFLGNIVLFAFGLMIDPLARVAGRWLKGRPQLLIAFIAFAALIYGLRFPNTPFNNSQLYLMPLFLIASALFCFAAIVTNPRLPLSFFFAPMGRHSYTIYLYHYQFMALLASAGLISKGIEVGIRDGWWLGNLVAIASVPVLIIICTGLDRADSLLRWRANKAMDRKLPAI